MTINVSALTETEFNNRLKKLLIQLEGKNVDLPYSDTAKPSHPTIGIRFDLLGRIVI